MLDRFEDSERLLQQWPEGRKQKIYLFLSIPYMDLSVAVIQLGFSELQNAPMYIFE